MKRSQTGECRALSLICFSAVANSPTKDAATPLMYASMSGRFNLVEILLEYGADINAKDNESGWTALMQGNSSEI